MKKIAFLILYILNTDLSYSQTDSPGDSITYQSDGKWIDETLEQCIKQQGQTNNGMVDCISNTLDSWEKQLQDTYDLLYSQMEGVNKTNLQLSQNAWKEYKKAQYKFLDTYYGSMQGTLYRQIVISEKIDVIKRRFGEVYNLTHD